MLIECVIIMHGELKAAEPLLCCFALVDQLEPRLPPTPTQTPSHFEVDWTSEKYTLTEQFSYLDSNQGESWGL